MRSTKPSSCVPRGVLCCLLLNLFVGAFAGTVQPPPRSAGNTTPDKISPDMRERLRRADAPREAAVGVILRLKDKPSGRLNALLNRSGVHVRAEFKHFDALAVELPLGVVAEVAAFEEVAYVSPDRRVSLLGHVTTTVGLDAARAAASSGEGSSRVDGSGVGVAVLDSGIYNGHAMFDSSGGGGKRIVRNVDFVCPTCKQADFKDMYGHGTHVAGLLAGNGRIADGAYEGVAPGATLVNLRVLNSAGEGTVSGVLSALNWVMANRAAYNIRVVNMSLGTPALDSYKDDPLCNAVRTLVDAGVVVVAAAGNHGATSDGRKIYGMIHAPGNEPSAITVGATNTFGTDARDDDRLASYSSRGPTRSYRTDAFGVRRHDNVVKPELVAPGNKLISSARTTYLPFQPNVVWPEGLSVDDSRRMLRLSGTSMAAPLVAGAAALMLQANPKLTPNMVKMILMYTAQPLAGHNFLEQGAGSLNVEGALRLTRMVRTDLSDTTPLGAPLLAGDAAPVPQTTVAGRSFPWSQGVILRQGYATGEELVTRYQLAYGAGILYGDGVMVSDGILYGDGTVFTDGILYGDRVVTSDGTSFFGGVSPPGTSWLLGEIGVVLGDGILYGDGIMLSDGVMISDGILYGDSRTLQSTSVLVHGESTPGMR